MRPIIFKYSLLHGKFPAPIIPIQIRGKLGWCEIWGYVDSGASFSIFGELDAKRLGLDSGSSRETMVTVGDGGQIPVALHHLPLRIGPAEFNGVIGFSPRLGIGFNLIGRKDIFERFDVTFRESQREIRFTPVSARRT